MYSVMYTFTKMYTRKHKHELHTHYVHIRIDTQAFIHHTVHSISRLTIVSREAKKKQAVRDEQVCYLQVAPLWNYKTL